MACRLLVALGILQERPIFQSPHPICPDAFHGVAGRLVPPLGWCALALVGSGLATALLFAPGTGPQGDSIRIAAIHYPASWVSLAIYITIGVLSVLTLRHRNRLTAMLAGALAPTGIMFTLLALWTESLWQRPASGIWWSWNAEAVSQMLLLFLLAGFIAIRAMIDDPRRGDRSGALLAVMGAVNLPVLYFSLYWWDMLRNVPPPALRAPMSDALAAGTLLIGAGFVAYAAFASLKRARCVIAERNAFSRALRRMLEIPA